MHCYSVINYFDLYINFHYNSDQKLVQPRIKFYEATNIIVNTDDIRALVGLWLRARVAV